MIRPWWALLSGLTGGLAFLVVIWDAIMGGIFGASFLHCWAAASCTERRAA